MEEIGFGLACYTLVKFVRAKRWTSFLDVQETEDTITNNVWISLFLYLCLPIYTVVQPFVLVHQWTKGVRPLFMTIKVSYTKETSSYSVFLREIEAT